MPTERNRQTRNQLQGDRRNERGCGNAHLGHACRGSVKVRGQRRTLVDEDPGEQQPASEQDSIVQIFYSQNAVHRSTPFASGEKKKEAGE